MTKRVTIRQNEIYEAIRRVLAKGQRPTYRNIAEEAKCNLSYAYVAVGALTKKGLIQKEPGKHAGITIIEP